MERNLSDIVWEGSTVYLILENNNVELRLDSKGIDQVLLTNLKRGDRIMVDIDERDNYFPKRIMTLYVETQEDLFQPFFRQPLSEAHPEVIEADYV